MSDYKFVEIKVEDLQTRHAYVRCFTCNKDGQKVEILASISKNIQIAIEDCCPFESWARFQTLKCCGCETVFFRTTEENSEDIDYDNDYRGRTNVRYNVTEKQYPEMTADRKTITDFHLLPDQLRTIYVEAAKALHSNQPVLAGIGIRAILETICKDKMAPGRNLSEMIDGLKGQGVLSPNGALVLHKLRVLGNSAAHEVRPHSDDQLSLAFDVLDNLLLNVYVLEPQATKIFP